MNGDPAAGWLEITRVFDAPVEDLWAAWTDPEQFALWYGPEGASIPLARFEDRLGGSRFVCMEMNPPQGTVRMFLAGEYLEYEPLRRLVYTEVPADSEGARLDSRTTMGQRPPGRLASWSSSPTGVARRRCTCATRVSPPDHPARRVG